MKFAQELQELPDEACEAQRLGTECGVALSDVDTRASPGALPSKQHALLEAQPDLPHVGDVGERVTAEREEARLVPVGE